MISIDIEKMSTTERMQTMEALWDALLHEDHEIESPGWHRKILEDRKEKIACGDAEFLSLKELKMRRG